MPQYTNKDFKITGQSQFKIKKQATKLDDLYESKEDYETQLAEIQAKIDELQNIMYAHGKHGVLVIFQAMDAAGKDGTMAAVFKNVHPLGLSFMSFKRPSETELAHDFMWRCYKELPERGTIKVFNRSYYEEVLVVKVHPEILQKYQKLPEELKTEEVWHKRYVDIQNFEDYLANNGIKVIKFFLNVSKKEQGERLIERIEDETKNWKFQEGDVAERVHWDTYMQAYEDMINATATTTNPWHIIPADDKKNMRLFVADIIASELKTLSMNYPEPDASQKANLKTLIDVIKEQDKDL